MRLSQRRHKKLPLAVIFVVVGALCVTGGYYAWSALFSYEPVVTREQPARFADIKNDPKAVAYHLFSETPASIKIDKIDVEAPIIPVGLTAEGAMSAPATLHDVGWYNESAVVGKDSRHSILLDGHYGTDNAPGVFYYLHKVVVGDRIVIIGDKGGEASYEVVEIEKHRLEAVDMKKAFTVYSGARQGVTLITCEGEYDSARATYKDRIVVYAVRV